MKKIFLLKALCIASAAVLMLTPVYADNSSYIYDESQQNNMYSYDGENSTTPADTGSGENESSYKDEDGSQNTYTDPVAEDESTTQPIVGEPIVTERSSDSVPSKAEAYDYFTSSHSGLNVYTNEDDTISYDGSTYKYNSTYGIYTKNGAAPTDEADDYTSYIEAYRNCNEERWIVYTLQNLYNEKQIKEGRAKNQSIAELQDKLAKTKVSLNAAKQNRNLPEQAETTVSEDDLKLVTGQLYVEAKVFDEFRKNEGDGYITVTCMDADPGVTEESELESYNIFLYKMNNYKQQYELPVGHYKIMDGGSATDLTAGKVTTKYDPEIIEFEITPNDMTALSIQLGNVDGTREEAVITISGNEPVKIESSKKSNIPIWFIIKCVLGIIGFAGAVFLGLKIYSKIKDAEE